MIHLLWDETHYERHAACGAIERSWAGERLNFTVAPEYASCAWCTEWRGVTDGNVSQNGGSRPAPDAGFRQEGRGEA